MIPCTYSIWHHMLFFILLYWSHPVIIIIIVIVIIVIVIIDIIVIVIVYIIRIVIVSIIIAVVNIIIFAIRICDNGFIGMLLIWFLEIKSRCFRFTMSMILIIIGWCFIYLLCLLFIVKLTLYSRLSDHNRLMVILILSNSILT